MKTLFQSLEEALRVAPELVAHVRAVALSGPEAGETLPQWNAPMRITAVQDSDDTFCRLVDWAAVWGERLFGLHWETGEEFIRAYSMRTRSDGFTSGLSSADAEASVSAATALLTGWGPSLTLEDDFGFYAENVTGIIRELRAKYPLDPPRKPRKVCPECGNRDVVAVSEWLAVCEACTAVYTERNEA